MVQQMNSRLERFPCSSCTGYSIKHVVSVKAASRATRHHAPGCPSHASPSVRWALLAMVVVIVMPLRSFAEDSKAAAMDVAASAVEGRYALRAGNSHPSSLSHSDPGAQPLGRVLSFASSHELQSQQQLKASGSGSGRTLTSRRKRRVSRRVSRRRRRGSSTYNSLGQVQPFKGDVYRSNFLALALDNRSYKRELILLTDTRPRAALQQFDNLVQLGLAHVLWLTESQAHCEALEALTAARTDLLQQHQMTLAQEGAGAGDTEAAGATSNANSQAAGHLLGDGAASYNASALMAKIADAAAAARGRRANPGPGVELKPYDHLGCAWYSQPFPDSFGGHRRLMMKRVMLLARSVRLGYNVLSLDTDVILFHNPYDVFKAPPYGSMHMVVGKGIRGGCIVNTGVMYFQNASRHGPVAWLLSEVAMRNLRWIEYNASVATASASGPSPSPSGSGSTPAVGAAAAAAAAGGSSSGGVAPLILPNNPESRGCWDQLLYADVVLTMMTGKLSLLYCGRPSNRTAAGGAEGGAGRGGEEDPGRGWTARHRQILGLTDRKGFGELMMQETTSLAGNPDMATLVTAEEYTTQWVNLTIPPRGPLPPLLPEEPGYELPPIRPRGLAERFWMLLAEDEQHVKAILRRRRRRRQQRRRLLLEQDAVGPGEVLPAGGSADGRQGGACAEEGEEYGGEARGPGAMGGRRLQQLQAANGLTLPGLWVNPSDTGRGLPPLAREVERMAYAADWLIGGWHHRGILGYWDPDLTNGFPKQVFAHLVRAPGPTSTGKEAVRMQYGEYDWQLAALDDGGPYPFLGSDNAATQPRVVALLPGVDTSTSTAHQWSNMARGLAQVALLTGRWVVWPSVPCSSKWVLPNPGSRRALPLNVNLRFFAHGRFAEGLMCTPVSVLHPKCLYERLVSVRNDTNGTDGGDTFRREGPRGMLEVEFGVLRGLLPEAVPGPHNTVYLQGNDDYDEGDGGERPVMFDEPPRTEGITYVKASAAAQALREGPLAAQPVLYLAQRTFLTQMDKLGDADLMARYRTFRNECPALR